MESGAPDAGAGTEMSSCFWFPNKSSSPPLLTDADMPHREANRQTDRHVCRYMHRYIICVCTRPLKHTHKSPTIRKDCVSIYRQLDLYHIRIDRHHYKSHAITCTHCNCISESFHLNSTFTLTSTIFLFLLPFKKKSSVQTTPFFFPEKYALLNHIWWSEWHSGWVSSQRSA